MDVQVKRGIIEVLVLANLKKEDSYGYQLIKNVSNYMQVSESTLYPILKRLEEGDFLVTYSKEYNGRLRRYYSITQNGKDKILDFINEWEEVEKVLKYIKGEENE